MANTFGRRDGSVMREEALEHARSIVDATEFRRLQAFEKIGADVLFAPELPDLAAVVTAELARYMQGG